MGQPRAGGGWRGRAAKNHENKCRISACVLIWIPNHSCEANFIEALSSNKDPIYRLVKWLRRRVSNHTKSTSVGSNPVVGTTNHKPTVNSAVNRSQIGKWVLRSNSEGTSTGDTPTTAHLKVKCFIQYQDFSEVTLRAQALETQW